MEGYSDRDYSNSNRKFGSISWDTIDDDLKFLLNHSDCDGHLSPRKCKKIAKRLTEIIGDRIITEADIYLNDENYHYYKTKLFRDGCMLAFKNKEKLKFH